MTELAETRLIAVGSNLPQPEGSPASNITRALCEMARRDIALRAVSRFFETPCFPPGAGPDYINAAVEVVSDLEPQALLQRLHDVEAALERTRSARWGMRTLDLDLLAVGQRVLPDIETFRTWFEMPLRDQRSTAPDQLVLPHPRLADRAFVLVPLADIAPDWVHPVTGLSVRQMLDALPASDRDSVRAI